MNKRSEKRSPVTVILACERTAHPLPLHCLQDLDHDWRRLRLVNRAMAAAFSLYKDQVTAHTAKREQLRRDCAAMSAELAAFPSPAWTLAPAPRDVWAFRSLGDLPSWARLWAAFEQMAFSAPEPATPVASTAALVEPVVFAVRHIYANHIFDAAFVLSARVAGLSDPQAHLTHTPSIHPAAVGDEHRFVHVSSDTLEHFLPGSPRTLREDN